MNFNIYIHKDAQEGAPDIALKGTLLVAIELHLFMQLSMHKSVQNDSAFQRVIQDAQEGDKKAAFDVALDVNLKVLSSVQSRTPLRAHLKICLMVYFEIYIKMHKKCI